jgi:hypothetical protein
MVKNKRHYPKLQIFLEKFVNPLSKLSKMFEPLPMSAVKRIQDSAMHAIDFSHTTPYRVILVKIKQLEKY